jgi:ethanolamine utilization protein EutP (predicted NTPase)
LADKLVIVMASITVVTKADMKADMKVVKKVEKKAGE